MRLVKLDAGAGAILTSSLRTDGVARRIDVARRQELERQSVLIGKALRELPLDAEGKAYFERLLLLAKELISLKE